MTGFVNLFSGISWDKVYKWVKTVFNQLKKKDIYPGIYEVIRYESTLEIKDTQGYTAIFRKYEKIRYLQNRIIAYQDQAWGDGKILVGYRCSPGVAVDRYRLGYKTHILFSLRSVKNMGDMDEFHIEWKIEKGFKSSTCFWATEVSHITKEMMVKVIFPPSRPPRKLVMCERNSQKNCPEKEVSLVQLPDKRWLVSWCRNQPKLYEQYILKWEW